MFVQDSREEAFLQRLGVKWQYTNAVRFEQLCGNWEIANFGRSKAKVEDAILQYAEWTSQGSEAPAPILFDRPDGLEVLDGVQRLGAAQFLNATEFSAYLIQTDSPLIPAQVRIFANLVLQGGHTESAAWTRAQAVSILVIERGMSIDDVRRLGGWRLKDVQEEVQAQTFGFAIRKIGGPTEMNKGVLVNIAEHAKLDDLNKAPKPIAEFCGDLKRGRFSNGDSKPLVKDFFEVDRKKKDLHNQFTTKLEKFREEPEVQRRLEGRPTTRLTPEINLRRSIRSLVTITEEMLNAGIELHYAEEFYHGLNQAKTNIQQMERTTASCR